METFPYDLDQAVTHLTSVDPVLGRVIDVVGPYNGDFETQVSPFESLCKSIAYQQLSGKAAATIYGRFRALTDMSVPLDPLQVMALPDEAIRSSGMSGAKTMALKDLASKTIEGIVPVREHLVDLSDEEIIERLTQVRGIGPWSVKMFLMMRLGRPDVLPHDDLGIRKGVQRIYALPDLPKPNEVVETAQPWRPFRSLASWYLWRSLEVDEDVRFSV